jgi:hypothetical protein
MRVPGEREKLPRWVYVVGVVLLLAMLGSRQNSGSSGSSSSVDDYPAVGERGHVHSNHKAFACYRRDDFEDFFKLLVSKDVEAEQRFAAMTVPFRCTFLDEGTEVIVDEHPFSDNFCVRPVGQTKCLWTNAGWVGH